MAQFRIYPIFYEEHQMECSPASWPNMAFSDTVYTVNNLKQKPMSLQVGHKGAQSNIIAVSII